MSPRIFRQLSDDDKEALADLLDSEGWKPLLKVIDTLTGEKERALISLGSSQGPERLFQQKLISEGARQLYKEIENLKHAKREAEKSNQG